MAVALQQQSWSSVWVDACGIDDIVPDSGVCALIGARQVAIVRVAASGAVYAIDNFDPFAQAFVISRGIVGERAGAPTIASPIYKHAFDLRSGQCLDDSAACLRTWPVRLRDGRVEIAVD